MKPEGASGLRNRQALPMVAIVDLTECLVIDHDRARSQARSWGHPEPWMSRECLDPAVANGRWYGPTHLLCRTGNYAASFGRCPRNARNAQGLPISHAA